MARIAFCQDVLIEYIGIMSKKWLRKFRQADKW